MMSYNAIGKSIMTFNNSVLLPSKKEQNDKKNVWTLHEFLHDAFVWVLNITKAQAEEIIILWLFQFVFLYKYLQFHHSIKLS